MHFEVNQLDLNPQRLVNLGLLQDLLYWNRVNDAIVLGSDIRQERALPPLGKAVEDIEARTLPQLSESNSSPFSCFMTDPLHPHVEGPLGNDHDLVRVIILLQDDFIFVVNVLLHVHDQLINQQEVHILKVRDVSDE